MVFIEVMTFVVMLSMIVETEVTRLDAVGLKQYCKILFLQGVSASQEIYYQYQYSVIIFKNI